MFCQSVHLNVNTLVSIDDFVSHMQLHQEAYGDTFIVFLSKHYGELRALHSKQQDHEQSDHERLPFNHCHQGHYAAPVVLLTAQEELVHVVSLTEIKEAHFRYTPPCSSAHLSGILQPPRYS